ncbi:type VI secretion system-associated FHA domain protein TagH, partial [Variovorax sp. Varisp62]
APPSSDDPFADLLAGLAPPAAPAASAPASAPAAALPDSLLFPDPMESGSRNAQAAQIDPFANLLGPTPSSAPAVGLGALDDFSDLGAPPMPPNSSSMPAALP